MFKHITAFLNKLNLKKILINKTIRLKKVFI